MSKPTLGQVVEIAQQQGHFIGIIEEGEYHFVLCEEAVDRFGDIEVKDLSFCISSLAFTEPCNEFKATIKVFI